MKFRSVMERLQEKRQAKDPTRIRRLPRDGRGLPLSSAQERLWFIEQLDTGKPTYNIGLVAELVGQLDRAALHAAFLQVTQRQESLRTSFESRDGEPFQRIDPKPRLAVTYVDLSAVVSQRRLAVRLASRFLTEPFDLRRAPLLRFLLLRLEPDLHVLAISQHHIVGDGWSTSILIREMMSFYRARLEGGQAELPPLPIQYADYAAWQKETDDEAALAVHLEFWRNHLVGSPPVQDLPGDRPRPAVPNYRGGLYKLRFSRRLTVALYDLARRSGTTPYVVLMAAFQCLLYRWSGQQDLVIGTPIANRSRSEVKHLIGFFANTLALRVQLDGRSRYDVLLAHLHLLMLEVHRHQHLPFEKLVEALQPERTLSHTPLFQVLFSYQNVPRPRLELPDLVLEPTLVATGNVLFDFTLLLREGRERLEGAIEFAFDLFDRTTIERLAIGLRRLLEAVASASSSVIAEIPWLGAAERHQLLAEWNDTRWDSEEAGTLAELFGAAARRHGEVTAVLFGEEALTYAELNVRANRLAHFLRGLGVGPETRVGVLLERCPDLVVALLGVLKAGGAYVPLDPESPSERLAWMVGDARLGVLLTGRRHRDLLAKTSVDHLLELDAEPRLAAAPAHDPPPRAVELNAAYVIYTSGSTGRPKGTEVPHGGVVNRLFWIQSLYPMAAGDRVLQKTPYTFDVSVWELFWPLVSGATLVLAAPGEHRDPLALARTLERCGITVVHFVPSLLAVFLEHCDPEVSLPALTRVFVSGEALSDELSRRFFARFRLPLENLYGPTEASIEVCHWRGRPPAQEARGSERVTIGRPIGNVTLYVVDRRGAAVPPGVSGQLMIGGVAVVRGYLGRPRLTAMSFAPDPFTSPACPGVRLYRTGDLVRLLSDGQIDFLGRVDHQVKIRGFRIELGEIESRLLEHDSVREVVVMAREAAAGTLLVAYVVAAPGTPPGLEELRSFLRRSLPEYMLPASVTVLDAMPLNANGKYDRRALPWLHEVGTARYVAPRTPVEEMLVGIWADVLDCPRVSIEDTFFDLGGHSLLIPRLLARLRQVFGVELSLAAFFERATVAALAPLIERSLRTEGESASPIVPLPRGAEPLALSFAQERVWYFDQLQPMSPIFNVPIRVRLRGRLDPALLAASLNEIARRHEVLRTSFPTRDGRPSPVVAPPRRRPLPIVDLTALGPAVAREAERCSGVEARRPFDLASGPLVRWRLLRRAPREHDLLLSFHHIVSDGWSLQVVVREMELLFRAQGANAGELPELPIQYADYAAWEIREEREGRLEPLASYWLAELRGAAMILPIPTDRPRSSAQTFRGAVRSRTIEEDLVRRLRHLSRDSSATLYMTIMAVFQMLFAAYGGCRDFVVGSPVANRNRPEVVGLVGFFVNMLALRVRLDRPGLTFREHLARVRKSIFGAYAHQSYPFDRLVQALQPERDPARTPIFQVVLAYQEVPSWDLDLPGLEVEILPPAAAAARYDLHLSVIHHGGRLHTQLTYNEDLYNPSTADTILERFAALCEAVCAQTEAAVERLIEVEILQPMRREEAMNKKKLSQDHRNRLAGFKLPKAPATPSRLVEETPLLPGESLPLLVKPAIRDVDLATWVRDNRELLTERLRRYGAILFRGFDIPSVGQFRTVAQAISPDLLDYDDPSTPRTEVGEKVYTSTEYPAEQVIALHNELSYNHSWPMKIFFYCVEAAQSGGETPLADSRRLYERLDPAVRQRFAERGVMYVRNFGSGYGMPWERVFRTSRREEVESYCQKHGMIFEWQDGGRLRTRHKRPAVARHPDTGELIWFNQANVHHFSGLPDELRNSLLAVAEDPSFPLDMNACYGDGSLIDQADIEKVRQAYDEVTVKFPWQEGDLLLADNMLVAHGRSSYSGPRRVMVLMAESTSDPGI